MKNKTWLVLILCMLAILLAAAIFLRGKDSGTVANIYQDGVCVRSIDLSQVTEAYSFMLTDADGHENLVEVAPGRIRVAEANCPDQICVNTGWLSHGVKPIVCLPAKLSIQLEETAASNPLAIDGVAG